jgi:hypothetical protein
MIWRLYDRNDQLLGTFNTPEAAMSVLGTGEIGMKWLPLSPTHFIGISSGGTERYVLFKEDIERKLT